MKEPREGLWRRGRERSFHAEGPKAEKAREPTVESLVPVKLKTVTKIRRSSARNIFIAESVNLAPASSCLQKVLHQK